MPLRRPFSAKSAARSIRPTFDRDEAFPTEQRPELIINREVSLPAGAAAFELSGTFFKRHGSMASPSSRIVHGETGARWAKRHVMVNDRRGTLAYCKHPPSGLGLPQGRLTLLGRRRNEPALALPLADVTRVRALPFSSDVPGHCLEVSCPPVNLVLRMDDCAARDRWVDGLTTRVSHWQRKAELESPAALPVFHDQNARWRLRRAGSSASVSLGW